MKAGLPASEYIQFTKDFSLPSAGVIGAHRPLFLGSQVLQLLSRESSELCQKMLVNDALTLSVFSY